MRIHPQLVLAAALLAGTAMADSKQAANDLLRRATDSASPQAAMKGAYRIQYELMFHADPGGPVEGAYALSWISKDQWRREISIADYSETAVSDGPSTWIARKPHLYQPQIVDGLLNDLESLADLKIGPGVTATKVKEENKNGLHLHCIDAYNSHAPSPLDHTILCFNDGNGELVLLSRGPSRTEFSDFEDKGGAFIARKIQHFQGKHLDAEADLAALTSQTMPAPTLLEHSSDARQFPNCNGDMTPADWFHAKIPDIRLRHGSLDKLAR